MGYAHDIFTRTKHKINGLIFGLNNKLKFDRLSKAKGIRILVYHGICVTDPFKFNTLFITQKKWEQQLQLYKKYFDIISLEDIYNGGYDPHKFSICLTFDDGFANNHKYVLPLLDKYQIPATFFVTSIRKYGYDFLWNDILSIAGKFGPSEIWYDDQQFKRLKGKYQSKQKQVLTNILRDGNFERKKDVINLLNSEMNFKKKVPEDYWLQMTTDQIKTLSSSKWVTIGSHSLYHNDLTKSSIQDLQYDLKESKAFLESITGREVKALAFPYGSYTKLVIEQAKSAGFTQILATNFLFKDDKYDPTLKERLTINPFLSPINQVHATISGFDK